jgi:hypothetical protein
MAAFDPDQYLKKKEVSTFDPDRYLATKEKSLGEKFMEPIKSMSVEDWKKNSLSGPLLQTLGGLTGSGPEQDKMLEEGLKGVKRKGDEILQGIGNFILDPATGISNAYNAITENPAGAAGSVVKGLAYDPQFIPGTAKAVAAVPGKVVNTAKTVGPVVKDVAGVVTSPIQTTKNFAGGFREGYFNPEGARPGKSALVPLQEHYYPPEAVDKFNKGLMSIDELEASRIYNAKNELFSTPSSQRALDTATTNAEGQKMIPLQDRKMEAFGEQLGREYANKPLMGIADLIGGIGGVATTGIPITPSLGLKAYQGLKTRQLGEAAGFNPEFSANYLNATGGKFAGPVAPPPTPKQASMEAAAAKINPVQPVAPPAGSTPTTPNQTFSQQLDNWKQIQGYKGPEVTTTTGPVAPTPTPTPTPKPIAEAPVITAQKPSELIRQQIDEIDNQASVLRENNLGVVKPDTPEGNAYQAQINEMASKVKELQKQYDDAVKLEKSLARKEKNLAKKQGPSNVSEMMVDPDKMWNTLKQPENLSAIEKSISEMSQGNRDKLEKVLREQNLTDTYSKELMKEHLQLFDKYRIKK